MLLWKSLILDSINKCDHVKLAVGFLRNIPFAFRLSICTKHHISRLIRELLNFLLKMISSHVRQLCFKPGFT